MTSKITTGESKSGFARSAEKSTCCGHWRKPWLRIATVLVGLGMCASAPGLHAQTNGPGPVYPANRYLLVVETSRAMQRHTNALVQIVQRLIGSSIGAQAHGGDTLGFWTYNEDVYTGVVPLQRWSKGNSAAIAERTAGFLRAQKFEKTARLDKVIPALDRINKNSQFITVILVCLGDADVHGTPFDATINQFWGIWRKKEQDAGAPFVIALRGQGGTFVDYTLNPSPWPAELPALPKELLTPLKPVEPVATVSNRPPASAVPPLIVSGRKHETTQTSTSTVPAALVSSTGSTTAANAPSSLPASPLVAKDSAALAAGTTNTPEPTSKLADPRAGASTPAGTVNSSPPAVSTGGNPPSGGIPASPADPSTLAANASRQKPPPQTPSQAAANSPALERIRNLPSVPRSASNSAALPTSEAVAVTPTQGSHLTLVVTGVVSLIALIGAIILWRARPRRTSDTSIITESFDRRKD